MTLLRAYYHVKPLVPRRMQLAVRSALVRRRVKSVGGTWPIDEAAGRAPERWPGWPQGKQFAFVLTHDVESAVGLGNVRALAELEMRLGLRSSFNFVPEGSYTVPADLRHWLTDNGFEIGIHDLHHDGKLFASRQRFVESARKINTYLRDWGAVGYRSGFMLRNLDWIRDLNVQYDASTFDIDPFEPQPTGIGTVFPFWVSGEDGAGGYAELPYTLPQDSTLFLLIGENSTDIWRRKLDWIAGAGGMALVNVHPDYLDFKDEAPRRFRFPVKVYREFLEHVLRRYGDTAWLAIPSEVAAFTREHRDRLPVPASAHREFKVPGGRRPLRVCMAAYTFYERDNRVMRYAEALAGRGDQVDVVALRRKGSPCVETMRGVTVHRLQQREINERGKLSYLGRTLAFLARSAHHLSRRSFPRRYDLVHVHSVPDFEVFAALLPKLRGTKVILDVHDIVPEFYASKFGVGRKSLVFRALKLVERLSASFADHVIIANHLWEKVITARSVPPAKCSTYLNYPDSRMFRAGLRSRGDDGRIVMIYPGSLNWHQGLDIAVRAFDLIKDQVPQAEFHVYGDGPSRDQLARMIEERDLGGRFRLMPSVPIQEIAGVMANADIGVVPKRGESFGGEAFSTKIFEFMALGVPVIAADTRIDKHYFDDTLLRFFTSGDERSLADAMLALARDPEQRRRLAESAQRYIVRQSWDTKRQDYFDLVDRLVGGTSA